ncbi:hypothetical protein Ancab_016610 [Ancistrocladus abbreviatus]
MPNFNYDWYSVQIGLGQKNWKVTAEPNSRNSRLVITSTGRQVSSEMKISAGTFMMAKTDSLKKREEKINLASSSNNQSPLEWKRSPCTDMTLSGHVLNKDGACKPIDGERNKCRSRGRPKKLMRYGKSGND